MTGAVRQPVWVDAMATMTWTYFWRFATSPTRSSGMTTAVQDIAAEVGLADSLKTVGAVWFDGMPRRSRSVTWQQDGDGHGLSQYQRPLPPIAAEAMGLAWAGRTQKDAANGTVRPVPGYQQRWPHRLDCRELRENGLFLSAAKALRCSAQLGIDIDALTTRASWPT